jgi:hypothetical protein
VSSPSDNAGRAVYEGRKLVVPVDPDDGGWMEVVEQRVSEFVTDIDPGQELYVSPIKGGEAIEVAVLDKDVTDG